MWSSQGSRNFLLSILAAILVVTGYVGAGGPMPAPFTGDTGAGGRQGEVPAPAAGDAAAKKILGAGGAWVTPASLGVVSGPPSSIDNQVPRYDGVTGALLQASAMYIGDEGGVEIGGNADSSAYPSLTIYRPYNAAGSPLFQCVTESSILTDLGYLSFSGHNNYGNPSTPACITGGFTDRTQSSVDGYLKLRVEVAGGSKYPFTYDITESIYPVMRMGLQLGYAYDTDGTLVFYSEQGATDYTTTFQPGTQTMNVAYTLPVDDGTSGQVLSTDGSGVLTWKPTWQGCTFSLAGGAAAAVSTGAHWEGAIYLPDAVYLTGWRLRGESGTSEVTVKRASFVDYYGATTSILTGTTIAKTACCTSLATNIATSPETAIAADTYLLIAVTAASETILALDLFGTKQ